MGSDWATCSIFQLLLEVTSGIDSPSLSLMPISGDIQTERVEEWSSYREIIKYRLGNKGVCWTQFTFHSTEVPKRPTKHQDKVYHLVLELLPCCGEKDEGQARMSAHKPRGCLWGIVTPTYFSRVASFV